jgi:hypothetical protein
VTNETNIYIMMGGMALFAVVVALIDWIGRRQERNSKQ